MAENALDQSGLLAQKQLGVDLTGRNQSDHCGLQSAAVADSVVVMPLGFVEAAKPYSAGVIEL